ncbi:MAG: FAD-binding oxidoreductase [Actinomycetota bacterium]
MSSVASARTVPLWIDQLDPIEHRAPLDGDASVDVAIEGGGFSGLWTAYYLSELDPTLRVAVIEKHYCGFGASGRNGGWAVGELAGSFAQYARRSDADGARRLARAAFAAVDEIGRVAATEGIDCDYAKGGTIRVARNRPQADRQREEMAEVRGQGFTEDEVRLLDASEARSYFNATEVRSGIFFAATAALHPAKLVRGLAEVVEARGVTVWEQTAVTAVEGSQVRTERGTVRASLVVQATEAYTRDLAGRRRDLLPVYSLMVATEPLPRDVLDEIGLAERPTFADDRHMVIYGQRTADDRLAFGGRGVPYLWGSRIARSAELHQPSHELLRQTLVEL